MKYILENQKLYVEVETNGAELTSIRSQETGREYLFDADARYWKRHAPVLFPIVGSLKDKKLVIDGKDYPMGQHGFARDRAFVLAAQEADSLWFRLESDEESRKAYPYDFCLEIGYVLKDQDIEVLWKVTNTGNQDLHYQIGGHPAFLCPEGAGFQFDTQKPIVYRLLNGNGLLVDQTYTLDTEEGYYQIPQDMFDRDALIIEDSQAGRVSLCTPDKTPYLTVTFDAPLFGLWSPAGKNAPFVCIEPWWGRADGADFSGSIEERDYDQKLAPGADRTYSFTITIEK